MKNLFEKAYVDEVKERIARLTPASQPQWGSMDVVQTVAHCSAGLDMAMGAVQPKRAPAPAKFLGLLIKPLVLNNDKPMRRNSPSSPELLAPAQGDLHQECAQLRQRIERFATDRDAICTPHPHPFFGPLTPGQWAVLMYKHLDHHLRQFGV